MTLITVESDEATVPTTYVQEPEDAPDWAHAVHDNYIRLTTALIETESIHAQVNANLRRHFQEHRRLNTEIDQKVYLENAKAVVEIIADKLSEELSENGIKLDINSELPLGLLLDKDKRFDYPLDFSPLKVYRYLSDKHAGGVGKKLLDQQIAEQFIGLLGHHQHTSVGNWDGFVEKSFERKGDAFVGYVRCYEQETWNHAKGTVDWKHGCRAGCVNLVNNLKAILTILKVSPFDGTSLPHPYFDTVIAKIARTEGNINSITYRDSVNYDALGLRFTFFKKHFEVKFSAELLAKISTFVSKNYVRFGKD